MVKPSALEVRVLLTRIRRVGIVGSFSVAAVVAVGLTIASCGTGDSGSGPQVRLETTMGDIVIQLMPDVAPKHSENFLKLVSEGFYDNTTFHRVIPGFMIQGGDPNSKDDNRANDGIGGPGYTVEAEISAKHERGSLAAARKADQVNPEKRSSGSQFYICVVPTTQLDGHYTVFGKVTQGMDIADKIVAAPRDPRDNPLAKIVIETASVE